MLPNQRNEQRTHEEYLLTEAGADLYPVLSALGRWGAKHTAPPANGLALPATGANLAAPPKPRAPKPQSTVPPPREQPAAQAPVAPPPPKDPALAACCRC